MNIRLIDDSTGKRYTCGKHRWMPNYVYSRGTSIQVTITMVINGTECTAETEFIVDSWSYGKTPRVNFEFNGGEYYFDDQDMFDKVRRGSRHDHLGIFTAEERIKREVKRTYNADLEYAGRNHTLYEGAVNIRSEDNDCTVKAMAEVALIKYDDAHGILKRLGRRDKKRRSDVLIPTQPQGPV